MQVTTEVSKKQGSSSLTLTDSQIAEISSEVFNHLSARVSEITTGAFAQGEQLRAKMVKDFRAEIENISSPRVLAVKLNENEVKPITKTASPYLPELIHNSKLGFNTFLFGPKGCGKTTLAHQLSEALGVTYYEMTFSLGISEIHLHGRFTPKGDFIEGIFSKAFRNGGVLLLDEVDGADENVLLAVNAALANGYFYNIQTGERIEKHKDFTCVAAANTNGRGGDMVYTGRNRLDGAFLDRFVKMAVYYQESIEKELCPDETLLSLFHEARKILESKKSKESISARMIHRIYISIQSGKKIDAAFEQEVCDWPQEVRDMVGFTKNGLSKIQLGDKKKVLKNKQEDEAKEAEQDTTKIKLNDVELKDQYNKLLALKLKLGL